MRTTSKVAKSTIKCDACSNSIDENTWYLVAEHEGKYYKIHDDDYCVALLQASLGLPHSKFHVSVNPDWVVNHPSRRASRRIPE